MRDCKKLNKIGLKITDAEEYSSFAVRMLFHHDDNANNGTMSKYKKKLATARLHGSIFFRIEFFQNQRQNEYQWAIPFLKDIFSVPQMQ